MTEVSAQSGAKKHQVEATFKNYDAAQAQKYADYRASYNPRLVDLIIKTHSSTGGQLNKVLDIGCGPGIATRQIAGYFQHVIGVDASVSMIEKAKDTPCLSATNEQATFHVCNSEDIDAIIEHSSVDLITVATAAHWFDMPKFYVAASKVLKPGGSIAMWCGGSWYVDRKTTPNADAVQRVWTELETEILKPFETPGNRLCRELYADLGLPWTVDTSASSEIDKTALALYDESQYTWREFNKDGLPDPDHMLAETDGYLYKRRTNLERAALMFGTASQVTRWRQHYKEQVEKGEMEDAVTRMLRVTKQEMDKHPEVEKRDWVDTVVASVLIVVKVKA